LQISLAIPNLMKKRNWSHLGYSNARKFGGCRHIAEITRKLGCVAKIWRQVVPVKYRQHPKAGSTPPRDLPRRMEPTQVCSTQDASTCSYITKELWERRIIGYVQ
jgi:transposase InsO family protein